MLGSSAVEEAGGGLWGVVWIDPVPGWVGVAGGGGGWTGCWGPAGPGISGGTNLPLGAPRSLGSGGFMFSRASERWVRSDGVNRVLSVDRMTAGHDEVDRSVVDRWKRLVSWTMVGSLPYACATCQLRFCYLGLAIP